MSFHSFSRKSQLGEKTPFAGVDHQLSRLFTPICDSEHHGQQNTSAVTRNQQVVGRRRLDYNRSDFY